MEYLICKNITTIGRMSHDVELTDQMQIFRSEIVSQKFSEKILSGEKYFNREYISGIILSGMDMDLIDQKYIRCIDLIVHIFQKGLIDFNFYECNLDEAIIINMYLENCKFEKSNLSKSTISETNLKNTVLRKSNLEMVNIRETDMTGVDLSDAVLKGANLEKVNLTGANLQGTDLTDANLEGANLLGAIMTNSIMVGTNFRGANLRDVDLSGANIDNANFEGACLLNVYFTNIYASDEILLNRDIGIGEILEKTLNIAIQRLSSTRSLYLAQLDPLLRAGIQLKASHLLKEPESISRE
jgi:uncharacterized protein YjbI with pentapeptide repeats